MLRLLLTKVITSMGDIEERIKAVYERKLGRELAEAEVLDVALWYRQFADLIIEWARDEELLRRIASR